MLNKKVTLAASIVAFMALWSCGNTNASKATPTVVEPTQEIISSGTETVAALSINMQVAVIDDYNYVLSRDDQQSASFEKTNNRDKVYRWNPETMWHTWEDDIANSNAQDAFYGHYKRGQQYFDANGELVKKAKYSVGLNFYYNTHGKYGYVNNEPTGTSWDNFVGTEETPGVAVKTSNGFLFQANGQYHTIWDGYYTDDTGTFNNDLVEFDTMVQAKIEELLISYDGTTVKMYGTINYAMGPYSAELTGDGNDTVTGVLKYNGVDVQSLNFSVMELMAKAQTLL